MTESEDFKAGRAYERGLFRRAISDVDMKVYTSFHHGIQGVTSHCPMYSDDQWASIMKRYAELSREANKIDNPETGS
jgi:hypothetical protein